MNINSKNVVDIYSTCTYLIYIIGHSSVLRGKVNIDSRLVMDSADENNLDGLRDMQAQLIPLCCPIWVVLNVHIHTV